MIYDPCGWDSVYIYKLSYLDSNHSTQNIQGSYIEYKSSIYYHTQNAS